MLGECCRCGVNTAVEGTCNAVIPGGQGCCPADQTIEECCDCGKFNLSVNTYWCYPPPLNGECCPDYAPFVGSGGYTDFECCECGAFFNSSADGPFDHIYRGKTCKAKDGAGECCSDYLTDGTCCECGVHYENSTGAKMCNVKHSSGQCCEAYLNSGRCCHRDQYNFPLCRLIAWLQSLGFRPQ